MHAVGNISNSRTKCHRAMWTTLLIMAVCLLLYQLYGITSKFLLRPVSTTVMVDYELPTNFPAVTVCNLNPLKFRKLKSKLFSKPRVRRNAETVTEDPHDDVLIGNLVFVGNVPSSCPPMPECATPQPVLDQDWSFRRQNSAADSAAATSMLKKMFSRGSEPTSEWTRQWNDSQPRSDFLREEQLMFVMNSISPKLRKELTYSIHDVMVDCSFLNRHCSKEDFVEIDSAQYGSCFVFNSGMNASRSKRPLRRLHGSGTGNSLTFTLFVDQANYLPGDSPVAGYKVIIHNPDTAPIPEEEGLIVRPGQFASLGVKRTVLQRAEEPYGQCRRFSEDDNKRRNMFLDQLPFTEPTMSVCMRTCRQLEVIRRCGCYSMRLGFAEAPAFDSVRGNRSSIPPCAMSGPRSDAQCVNSVSEEVATGRLNCQARFCDAHECNHHIFETSMSDGAWPARQSVSVLKRQLASHPNTEVRRSLLLNESYDLRENFLKIQVYLSDLTVVRLRSEPNYLLMDLLSDLGGNAGLWLGLSVFTVFELGAFLFDFICGLYKDEEQEERRGEEVENGKLKQHEQSAIEL